MHTASTDTDRQDVRPSDTSRSDICSSNAAAEDARTEEGPLTPADLRSLFHSACRGLRRNWIDQLKPWDLTPFQGRALNRLQRAGGELRPGELATQLRIAPRSATEVVDQLEERGLVERVADPSDRRARLVRVLPKGEELLAEIATRRGESAQTFFSPLNDEEQMQLAFLLRSLVNAQQEARQEPQRETRREALREEK